MANGLFGDFHRISNAISSGILRESSQINLSEESSGHLLSQPGTSGRQRIVEETNEVFLQVEFHKTLVEQHLNQFKGEEYAFVKYLNVNDDVIEGEAREQAMWVLRFSPLNSKRKFFDLVPNVETIVVIICSSSIPSFISIIQTRWSIWFDTIEPSSLRCCCDRDKPGAISGAISTNKDSTNARRTTWTSSITRKCELDSDEEPTLNVSLGVCSTCRTSPIRTWSMEHFFSITRRNTSMPNLIPMWNLVNPFEIQWVCEFGREDNVSLVGLLHVHQQRVELRSSDRSGEFQHFTHSTWTLRNFQQRQSKSSDLPDFVTSSLSQDWKARYLHPDYQQSLEPNATIAQPCPDVYWFPMVSQEFTESLINVMETHNEWSGAAHKVCSSLSHISPILLDLPGCASRWWLWKRPHWRHSHDPSELSGTLVIHSARHRSADPTESLHWLLQRCTSIVLLLFRFSSLSLFSHPARFSTSSFVTCPTDRINFGLITTRQLTRWISP